MTVQAEEMLRAVRVAIDMNRGDEALLRDCDTETLRLDEIILAKLADAVRIVEMEASPALLESGHDFANPEGDNVYIGEDGKGFIILPNDFMRLVSFRMSDWGRTVYEAISERDREYGLQSSRFKGICGNWERPVVAIVRRAAGLVLEFYSCRDGGATVAEATYLPYPRIDDAGGIDVAEGCYRAAVYRAASLALGSVGDPLSTTMLEMSRSLVN